LFDPAWQRRGEKMNPKDSLWRSIQDGLVGVAVILIPFWMMLAGNWWSLTRDK
jgi:hypothetical protein